MITPRFYAVNQHWVNPDPHNSIRTAPTRRRRWRHQRPKSPRVVIPVREPRVASQMGRQHNTTPGSRHSKSPHKKRKRRVQQHTPVLRREQAPRDAKPIPSIEESVQKGPFDPYAFLSKSSTPSLSNASANESTALWSYSSGVSPRRGKTDQPQLPSVRPREQSFGHRHSLPYRCSPRRIGSTSQSLGQVATENAGLTLSLDPRPPATNDTSNGMKREETIPFTPLIRNTTVAASLQNTQVRERKLEENGVVELDRDEYALQRFLKVQGEISDLEAMLMKGTKKHIFEELKRNAATNSLRGAEKIMAENDATPTPSARPIRLADDIISKRLMDEQPPQVASKGFETRTETSKGGPASSRDVPSGSVNGKDKMDGSQKEPESHQRGVHPSRKHLFNDPECSRSQQKAQNAPPPKPPLKRKELPGLGLIFNPRPNQPQDDREHHDKKLPRDLKRREVDMPASRDTVEDSNNTDVEGAIDSAQDWLQQDNVLYQEAREKRWKADPNWKHLTADQVEKMRRQGSIPPAKFYGHPPRWRPPTGWKQPPVIEKPMFTVAKADQILAQLNEDRLVRGLQRDTETEVAPSEPLSSKDGKDTNKHSLGKAHSSTSEENKQLSTSCTANLNRSKTMSRSSKKRKDASNATDPDVVSQRSVTDDKLAAKPKVKNARDMEGPTKMKSPSKKRKHGADMSETTAKASTPKIVPESPNLPSMEEIMNRSQTAVAPSSAQKKKRKKSSGTEPNEDSVNDAQEPLSPSKSKKRKKAKETIEECEVARDEAPATTTKRKKSKQPQESNEAVVEKSRPETFIERLRRLKREENARALQKATEEPSQLTIPASEADKANAVDRPPPTAAEPVVEDIWQPTLDDEDPVSSPKPSPPKRKRHRSKHDRRTDASPATVVEDNVPETIESPTSASSPAQLARPTFNQHRRRHQSLPPPATTATALTADLIRPTTPTSIPPHTNLSATLNDLHLHSIRTRLSNLEAAITNPRPLLNLPPNAHTYTPTALQQLLKPLLPRAIPPGQTQLSDAELIEVGNYKSTYARHVAAPYAFSWRGRLYAQFDYLFDWVDGEGEEGWDERTKRKLKHA